jgi:hypothetical protein
VNHLDEFYGGEASDIWDCGYVLVDSPAARVPCLSCACLPKAAATRRKSARGPQGKIECLVPGPGRFWPAHLGEAPTAKVIVSPRNPQGPYAIDIPVDPHLLAAGDHNGSTF